MDKKMRKIVFSEEIDAKINGLAVGISFLGIGIFLLFESDYFFIPFVTYLVGGVIGFLGVGVTSAYLSKDEKIKGLGNFFMGIGLLLIWFFVYANLKSVFANVIFFAFLIVGCFAILQGIFQAMYSIFANIRLTESENSGKSGIIKNNIGQILIFLTQFCSLIIAVINIVKAVGEI